MQTYVTFEKKKKRQLKIKANILPYGEIQSHHSLARR